MNRYAPCLLLLLPLAAAAQAPADETLLGAGLRLRPAYDGSASRKSELIPVVRWYGKPWFARTTQGILEGGARAELAPGLALGAQLAYEPGRRHSESELLRRRAAPDLDPGASVGAHLEWDTQLGPAPLTTLVRVRRHAETGRGTQADLRLTAGVYGSGRARAGVFTQATWASAQSMRAFYEVSGGGLLYASVGALGSYELERRWLLVASVERRRLQGDAAHGPLVERRSAAYASAGVAYRF